MEQEYWFLRKREYGPSLQRFAITDTGYLAALQEVTTLFPREASLEYFRAKSAELGGLNHFDLLPYPNRRLPYNPVPILLNVRGAGILSQLLYLGLALRDFKKTFGVTKAFRDLLFEENYLGALFEIEVGAHLARSGLHLRYSKASPDYVITKLSLGVEATTQKVPMARVVAERLFATLAFLEFKHLSIELAVTGEQVEERVVDQITKDVEQLLVAGETEVLGPNCRIRHDQIESMERTIAIRIGRYRYEETLSHLISSRLEDKEEKIRKARAGASPLNCLAALDVRSLLGWPSEPESEYERQLVERNQSHFERLRALRQEVVRACQAFVARSSLIKGTLLWERKRMKTAADEVYRRYSVSLITANRSIELDSQNVSSELISVAQAAESNVPKGK